jgi:anti-sigma regulatory factor (Ser/Thr protein kinase)
MPPYRDRKIFVSLTISRSEVRIVIRDDGPGFDVNTVPNPKDPNVLEREGGHGLVLMQTFMDEVRFNERGNEVTMIKKCESSGRFAI